MNRVFEKVIEPVSRSAERYHFKNEQTNVQIKSWFLKQMVK